MVCVPQQVCTYGPPYSMLFPPWTVTGQVCAESLTAQHAGISNDVLLFSEVGLSLVHHYRVHRKGLPHAAFRGRYLEQLRSLLPVNTALSTAGGPSGPACSTVPSTAYQTDILGATPRPPRRRRRPVRVMDLPVQIAPRLTEQDPRMTAGAVVFDCRLALLPVSLDVSGIDMLAVRSSVLPAKTDVVPPVCEQPFGGGGGGADLLSLILSRVGCCSTVGHWSRFRGRAAVAGYFTGGYRPRGGSLIRAGGGRC